MIRKTIVYRASKIASMLCVGCGFLLHSEVACATVIGSVFGFVCASEYIISRVERRRQRIVEEEQQPLG